MIYAGVLHTKTQCHIIYTELKKKVYTFLIIMLDCMIYALKQMSIYMIWENARSINALF